MSDSSGSPSSSSSSSSSSENEVAPVQTDQLIFDSIKSANETARLSDSEDQYNKLIKQIGKINNLIDNYKTKEHNIFVDVLPWIKNRLNTRAAETQFLTSQSLKNKAHLNKAIDEIKQLLTIEQIEVDNIRKIATDAINALDDANDKNVELANNAVVMTKAAMCAAYFNWRINQSDNVELNTSRLTQFDDAIAVFNKSVSVYNELISKIEGNEGGELEGEGDEGDKGEGENDEGEGDEGDEGEGDEGDALETVPKPESQEKIRRNAVFKAIATVYNDARTALNTTGGEFISVEKFTHDVDNLRVAKTAFSETNTEFSQYVNNLLDPVLLMGPNFDAAKIIALLTPTGPEIQKLRETFNAHKNIARLQELRTELDKAKQIGAFKNALQTALGHTHDSKYYTDAVRLSREVYHTLTGLKQQAPPNQPTVEQQAPPDQPTGEQQAPFNQPTVVQQSLPIQPELVVDDDNAWILEGDILDQFIDDKTPTDHDLFNSLAGLYMHAAESKTEFRNPSAISILGDLVREANQNLNYFKRNTEGVKHAFASWVESYLTTLGKKSQFLADSARFNLVEETLRFEGDKSETLQSEFDQLKLNGDQTELKTLLNNVANNLFRVVIDQYVKARRGKKPSVGSFDPALALYYHVFLELEKSEPHVAQDAKDTSLPGKAVGQTHVVEAGKMEWVDALSDEKESDNADIRTSLFLLMRKLFYDVRKTKRDRTFNYLELSFELNNNINDALGAIRRIKPSQSGVSSKFTIWIENLLTVVRNKLTTVLNATDASKSGPEIFENIQNLLEARNTSELAEFQQNEPNLIDDAAKNLLIAIVDAKRGQYESILAANKIYEDVVNRIDVEAEDIESLLKDVEQEEPEGIIPFILEVKEVERVEPIRVLKRTRFAMDPTQQKMMDYVFNVNVGIPPNYLSHLGLRPLIKPLEYIEPSGWIPVPLGQVRNYILKWSRTKDDTLALYTHGKRIFLQRIHPYPNFDLDKPLRRFVNHLRGTQYQDLRVDFATYGLNVAIL